MASPCPQCGGEGKVVTDPCQECKGQGRLREKQHVKVHIPAGVDTGMRLKMSGYGDAGESRRTSRGSYMSSSMWIPTLFLKEKGMIYYSDLPIGFAEAALGTKKEIPTLYETCRLQFLKGLKVVKHFVLKEKDFPMSMEGGGVDLSGTISSKHPPTSRKQKEMLKEFGKTEGCRKPSHAKKVLWRRLKSFFSDFRLIKEEDY